MRSEKLEGDWEKKKDKWGSERNKEVLKILKQCQQFHGIKVN